MTATAIDKGPPGRDDQYGYGVIDLVAALTADVPPRGFGPGSTAGPDGTGPTTAAADGPRGGGERAATVRGLVTLGVLVAAGVTWVLFIRRRRRSDDPPLGSLVDASAALLSQSRVSGWRAAWRTRAGGNVGGVPDALPLRLVLASASPARRKSLQSAGIEPDVLVSGVDESLVVTDRAEDLCLELARLKAQAVLGRLRPTDDERTLVLGCDSVLAFDGEILGKPDDEADATRRWERMRGRSGVLHSGHCLVDIVAGRRAEAVASTVVHFADISDHEIATYVATGEPLAVAGAFTIDGLGGPFVERIEGDPGTVVGLSLPLLRSLLAELDLRITDLWTKVAPGNQIVEPLG
ncbi:hypothetical protein GCM10029963_38220 [Micromonospora andamanensis]